MKRNAGFTLLELLVSMTIIGILSALAIPAFGNMMERNKVSGAAQVIYGQLAFARTEAIKRFRPISIQFAANGTDQWALGITDINVNQPSLCNPLVTDAGTPGACTIDFDNDPATDDRVLMRLDSGSAPGILMKGLSGTAPSYTGAPGACESNGVKPMVCFDPLRGQARNGRVVLASDNYEVHVVTGIMGRSRLCSPPGAKKHPAYPNC
jgi:type IV fimbrial biogenesis protein FimT